MLKSYGYQRIVMHALLLALCAGMAFPFYWMVTSGLKTNDEVWQTPPALWPAVPLWHNFVEAWQSANFGRYMLNSVTVAFAISLIKGVN
jgi:multiple sugar transport system permease protein